MSLYRLTLAVILVALACLVGCAWEHTKTKRFARQWAQEILEPTYTLIK